MSNGIKLEYGKEIRAWMQVAGVPGLLPDFGDNDKPKRVPEDGDYYRVEHTVCTPDGIHLLTIGRIYIAHSAEEALGQYLFGYPSQVTGKGTDTVFTKLWGYFFYDMQDIKVSLLPDGEYYPC
jgi:hypothetical protein